jgi:hypothetical protein
VDALGKNVKLDFCILKSFETCSTEVEIFGPENGGVKKFPFTCTIEVDIQGSICGVGHEPGGRPGSSYCLPGISVPVP